MSMCSNHILEAFTNITLVDDTGEFIASASVHQDFEILLGVCL